MLDNKYMVNLYVLSLDKNFEIFVPADEKVGNIIKLISKSLFEYGVTNNKGVLLNLYTGTLYNNNDIVRNVDIINGTKLILV